MRVRGMRDGGRRFFFLRFLAPSLLLPLTTTRRDDNQLNPSWFDLYPPLFDSVFTTHSPLQ